jgi:hypothetical protein
VVCAGSGDEGKAAAVFLKLDPLAGSAGVGSAYVARARGAAAVHFNPAGLASQRNSEASFTHFDIFEGIKYNYLGLAGRTRKYGGGYGVAYKGLDYGEMKKTEISGDNPVTGLGEFDADDISLAFSFGRRLGEKIDGGITVKYVKESIAGYDGSVISGDLGIKYYPQIAGYDLEFGVAARNIVGDLKLDEDENPLPRQFAVGGVYTTVGKNKNDRVYLSADGVYSNDADVYYALGCEYLYNGMISLRAGYNDAMEADDGFTLGFGMRGKSLSVDYSVISAGNLGDYQRLSLTYNFDS